MNRKQDTAYGINRLESKNARAAIIQKISADFNLMPIVAEAYSQQILPNMPMSNSLQGRSAMKPSLQKSRQANTSLWRRKSPVD